ncbi:hypothetical protein GCM10010500_46100 [Streptomyces nigrescens]|nr:hypothetical protein GCM10010500_46100 [Streptomyces libani subsp. libani]
MPLKVESGFRLRTRQPGKGRTRGPRAPSPDPTGVRAGSSPAAWARCIAAPPDALAVPPVKDAGHTRPAGPMVVRSARRAPPTSASDTADAHPEA